MNLLFKIIFIAALAFGLYNFSTEVLFLLDYSNNHGFRPGVFGNPVSFNWVVLVLCYWSIFIAGLLLLLFRNPVGWSLLMPVSLLGIIYLSVAVFSKLDRFHFFEFTQLVLAVTIVLLINRKSFLSGLKVQSKGMYYVGGAGLFIVLAWLFLVTNQFYGQ